MSSIRRWVLTHTELEVAVHRVLLQFQLNFLSFLDWFFGSLPLDFAVVGALA